jgi:hypothetical protein
MTLASPGLFSATCVACSSPDLACVTAIKVSFSCSIYFLAASTKLPIKSQVFADSTYANKNKQTNNIHPFKLF